MCDPQVLAKTVGGASMAGERILAGFDRLSHALGEAVKYHYGPRLVSLAVFGSVARRTPGPASDVDFLVVASPLPDGRSRRMAEFDPIEASLIHQLEELELTGVHTQLSPVFRTPAEVVQYGGPIFLDMTEQVIILYDPHDFLGNYLTQLRSVLVAGGARKLFWRGVPYWDLAEERRGQHF